MTANVQFEGKLRELLGSLEQVLPDEFSRKVVEGSMMAFAIAENPLRLSQFASGFRELYGHSLHTMAPDDQIRASSWFEPETQDGRPTRRQRVRYAIQGGIADPLLGELGFDAGEIHGAVISVIDELSKYTHVRPNTIGTSAEEADAFACETIATYLSLMEILDDCRQTVRQAVAEAVDKHALEVFTQEVFSEVDILSNRTMVEAVEVTSLTITAIGASLISYHAHGDVYVELSYGSKSDFRNDNGAEISTDFPFSLSFAAPVTALSTFQDAVASIDTSSWYDEGEDDSEDNFSKITDY
ncbi:hypothetical protein [Neorhizobium galegae]|uniref:pPIWI-associating nuclease domain-containing protein n=1 Tax=Neorhizobium galegae TaxID=399 RepID=UPI001F36796E|nr:hypothetical protein [Neorhizobium galegae]UIK08980.1 hypothetical protein LZK81_28670 [Neorhizobium galegae]